MSEYDQHDQERRKDVPPEAVVTPARWSPWVWVVPVLAIFFAGYLVVRYGFFGGGDITVRFVEARGLDRYSPVRYRGAKVGTVQKITVDADKGQVVVRISMDAAMNDLLRKGTRFWIVEPGLESGGLNGLLSGTYVAVQPGEGEDTSEFVGDEYAPIVAPPEAGKTIILEGAGTGAIGTGTPVQYQGMRVGRVLGSRYDAKSGTSVVHVFISQRFADRVRQSTRFYRGGGFNLSLGGGGLSAGAGGIASLISSPIAFYTPEVLAGEPVANGTHFLLYQSDGAAVAAADGPQLEYVTYFPGPVRGLGPGTPVFMKGVEVGRVRNVRLRYVAANASLETPVTFVVDPRKMEMPVTDLTTREDLRFQLNDAMQKMVAKGMRATLSTSLVLPGASGIGLDFVARPGTGRLVTSVEPPIVPAASAGSGLEGALAAVNDIAARIRNLPIEEIAGDLRSTARRMNTIVHDPVIDQSLQRLDRSMAEVERITATVGANADPIAKSVRNAATSAENAAKTIEKTANTASQSVGPIVESLRNAASAAETAAGRANQLMGSSARQGYDLGELIKELTRAAEAVRALASYLEENPDALLKGRGKAK